ncbi:MAG: hypothetical protein WC986_14615 [Elusimicrobiota bacterium]|jgi:hypothetical protein
MKHFIVQSACAKMPASVKAPYRRIAVLEVEPGVESVKMISTHARGVVQVVATWEKLHAQGKVTAYDRAMVEAEALCAKLNTHEAKLARRRLTRARKGLRDARACGQVVS